MSMKKELNKKGQVTIFILVGIVIVSVILVFFLWARPTYFAETEGRLNFESCVEDVVEESIEELEKKAGLIDPDFTYAYDGEDLAYLCYTADYLETCVVQVPFLKNVFDEGMRSLVRSGIDACYDNSLEELRLQGYSVVAGDVTYDVLIEPGIVSVEIEAPTTVGSERLARFNVRVASPVYEMVMIATSIVQFEAELGDSDASSIMLLYPDYVVEKIKRGDGTTVYILESKVYGDVLQFASRSLVFPAGYVMEGGG